MKTFTIIILFIICSFLSNISAMDLGKIDDKYIVKNWNDSNGFTVKNINSIAQTGDGYLWFGTSKGLFRFDGIQSEYINFDTDGPKKQPVRNLLTMSDGALWFVITKGLVKYQENRFTFYHESDGFIRGDKISIFFEEKKGVFLIGCKNGDIFRLKNNSFTKIENRTPKLFSLIHTVFKNKKNEICLLTDCGIFKLIDDKFIKYSLQKLKDNLKITGVKKDKSQDLWIIANNTTIYHSKFQKQIYPSPNPALKKSGIGSNITSLLLDHEGALWVSKVNGVIKLRFVSSVLPSITKNQGNQTFVEGLLKGAYITASFLDKENNIWFATKTSGLFQVRESPITSYYNKRIALNNITCIIWDNEDGIIVGTAYRGIFRYKNHSFKQIYPNLHLKKYRFNTIWQDRRNNDLWLGTQNNGILVINQKQKTTVFHPQNSNLLSNKINTINTDSDSRIWVGTDKGIGYFKDGIFKTTDFFANEKINNIYEDRQKKIWIASEKGVIRIDPISQKITGTYLKGTPVSGIHEDEYNVFWFGTMGNGISRLKNNQIFTITTKNKLISNFIYQIYENDQGYFWISSDEGIYRVNKTEFNSFFDGEQTKVNGITYLSTGKSNNIRCVAHAQNSLTVSSEGKLFFASDQEICGIHYNNVKADETILFDIKINKIMVNEKEINLPLDIYKGKVNTLDIKFAQPTFIHPAKLQFQYKLDGYFDDWIIIEPNDNRLISFKNLPFGEFYFQLRSSINSNTFLSFKFSVRPLFFQSTLFYILLISVIILGVFFIFKDRFFKKSEKYKSSPLNVTRANLLLQQLTKLIEVDKIYTDDNISLKSLSEKLKIPSYQLSQLINERLNKNFYDLINSHRIEDAKQQLILPETKDQKILMIAYNVGFKSQAAFYKAFKRYVNLTPVEFKNKNLK